jgi:hypothetical protein
MPRSFLRGFFFAMRNARRRQKRRGGGAEMQSGINVDDQMKQDPSGVAAATLPRPKATYGEVFADGVTIEIIRGTPGGNLALLLSDGAKEIVGARVEHDGQLYEPAPINASLLQELILPTRCCPYGSTREFLAEACRLIANYTGLPEKFASLVGRVILCSALVEALSVAPTLTIVGPDTARGIRLMELLRCVCWHALPLTGVTPAGFCSLASGVRFTYLISQSSLSDKLWKLLDDAGSRDQKIPFRGSLLDLFGAQVIQCDPVFAGNSWAGRSIQIPMAPTDQELPAFDFDARHRTADEFQAKLLSFRRANLGVARKMDFDASKFAFALRDRARSLAAATPDDRDLQAEVFDLLQEEDAELRADKWIDPAAIAGEAVLVACHGSPGGIAYVAELAAIAEETLRRREEETTIEPAVFGQKLKLLGFATTRDAKGKKLQLTAAVRDRAQRLVRDFGAPEGGDGPSQAEKESWRADSSCT